ncbi:LysR substrate-binding domain-containing protein [Pararoseomonas indoligenes]|uniref:LysR family transcriptional regulator n=1 Tax=Roseomonas indoligenes TaxID=2820811 RepID=A0A940S9A3_9PROT|nr:LysR substrate-binding domain-containing protein [Pararoseomonas indoligenes]MBP0494937.1 LysR family transcriptional regulator [Pararoseomonas indoligenes]
MPPLNALKAFEAVARHGTLARAAEELLVTPTAVGRHVRNLEDVLQIALFERDGGALRLTVPGRRYAGTVARALGEIADATDALRDSPGRTRIAVRAYTTFLVRWLIPRLASFQARYPEIEVTLSSGHDPVDFNRERVDAAIRYGRGIWPGLVAVQLFEDELVAFGPLGSRARLEHGAPAALLGETLIIHQRRPRDWADWLAAADMTGSPARTIAFDDLALVWQAVTDGLGIGLTQRRYLAAEVKAGRLEEVSDVVLRRGTSYYLTYPADTAARPALRTFAQWMQEEAGATKA